MSEVINAEKIQEALSNTYSAPEWYLGLEVGNSTGADCKRHADAVAINAYPSKGFETRGFEIKVAKSDLAAELKNGIKSDEVARFCDYWFLVTPKGLSDGFTLPPTWGVLEYHDGKLRQKIRAKKLNKITPNAGFLCAMLRGRERLAEKRAKKVSAECEERIMQEALWRAGDSHKEIKQLRDKLDEIKSATGISLDRWAPTQSIINRLNAAQSLHTITSCMRAIEVSAKRMLEDAADIKAAADVMMQSKGAERDEK